MKKEHILIITVAGLLLVGIVVDQLYVSRFNAKFTQVEQARITVSNKLATAKIVSENLNHVRDLVFKNMDFDAKTGLPVHEAVFYDFITTSVADLKLKLVSLKPVPVKVEGAITEIGYDIELEGDFFSFGELCAKFENSRRIITIESFKVERRDAAFGAESGGLAGKTVRISMRVNTFRIKKG